jgi:hypothetical protein
VLGATDSIDVSSNYVHRVRVGVTTMVLLLLHSTMLIQFLYLLRSQEECEVSWDAM